MMRKRRKKKKYSSKLGLGFPKIEISDDVKKDVIGIFLLALAAINILSLVNLAGGLGGKIKEVGGLLFGMGFVMFPIALILCGLRIIKSEDTAESRSSFFGVIMMILALLSFLHIFFAPETMLEAAKEGTGGGFLGAALAWPLVILIGKWGAMIIILTLFLISILLIFNISLAGLVNKIKGEPREVDEEEEDEIDSAEEAGLPVAGSPASDEEDEDEDLKINIAGQEIKEKEKKGILAALLNKAKKEKEKIAEPEFSVKEIDEEDEIDSIKEAGLPTMGSPASGDGIENLENAIPKSKRKTNWQMLSSNILDGNDGDPTSGDIRANSNIIKRTLINFGIQIEMGEVNVGPTVTQYTMKPSVGIKLSRITSLQNDLALALAARSLRIEAPILGKSLVGIEIPNQSVAMVRMKNMINSEEFKKRKSNLGIILGRDVSGYPVIADLAKMPHLMIAGSTGSGKTVCINTLIVGLLFQNSPETLKFIMVDPKRVELTPYNDIPHLLTPVITDPDKAINSLKWSITEMENRYDLLSHLGCRNIESYNEAVKTKFKQRDVLPYIIIIIDELADLMATHGREMEAAVVRLAQMARAVGIHLVLSTQRPSVEVITGLIKANITTRIAFQVASQIDSRTILDTAGAEKLLGSGDMLYLSGDSNKPRRIQGVFISEEEVRKITGFLKNQKEESGEEYNEGITESKKSSLEFSADEGGADEDLLYDDAVEVVKNAGKASASLLQRRLRVGYARAARLLDIMEDKGIVGPADGAKPREVYDGYKEESDKEEEI
ncbi:MAG: DNA translocase FtsK [Candidatus Pacebacteria bacterium]|nr:DNA translocase FtsK [Candidatus Paceibacterota bacterium]